ncbi:MAG: PEP-CTERM sorting domain-containing protein [Planctomycetales bacterium]|nr:PEP-CTERM sorting domain-containing protein [Planctomycetales bacterium]
MTLCFERITRALLLAVLAYLSVSNVAFGAIVTYAFSGTIERLYESDYLESTGGYAITYLPSSSFFEDQSITVGDRFQGTFSYDTGSKASISSDGAQASYLDAVVSASLTIGTVALPSSTVPLSNWFSSIAIVNDRDGVLGGRTDILQISPKFSGDEFFVSTTLSLQDRTANVFNDLSLPEAVVAIEAFQAHLFQTGFLNRATRDQLQLAGTLDSFEAKMPASVIANIPEPSTLALVAIAMMGACARPAPRRMKNTRR